MSTTSVGQIGLDLVVNQKQFNKQMSGIQSLASKVGKSLAVAFSVKKIVDFGKECVNLGSDLQEVQNVVDVTFPNMTEKVNEFAQSAAASFGLSETMAKKFTGTFGSMAKAFGFSEAQAYEMGSTLTGLAGDVASFYNLTQDEAYTKLKSVFTGETESLKDLGVVMTQTALDSYAMANGFEKTTSAMSEAEKVALRYAFVQDQLSAASGDFARTSDGWANQTRVLKLQFDSLKATIGQGLINVLTPVIKVVNTLMSKLSGLAETFKAFTELLTGKKASDSPISSSVADTEALTESVTGVGEAAEASAKKMAGLIGIDELNNLSQSSGDSSSGGTNTSASVDYGSLAEGETILEKTSNQFQGIIDKANELKELFVKGFTISFGDSESKISSIKKSLSSIKTTLLGIATDSEVTSAFENMIDSIAFSFGEYIGMFASIGTTIANNLASGISNSLKNSKGFIKERLVSIFDAKAEVSEKVGELFTSISDVFEVFSNEDATSITSGLTTIFSTAFFSITDLASQFAADVTSVIIDPFVNNTEGIKQAAENFLNPVADIVDTVSKGMTDSWQKVLDMYEKDIKPLFTSLSDGITDIVETALEAYNQHIAPVLEKLATKFTKVWNEHIKPTIDKVIKFIGKIGQTLQVLWETILQPLINWLVKTIIPIVAPIIEKIGTKFMDVFSTISDVIGGIFTSCSGLLDFICGVFTGDWEKAWNGVKTFFKGIWDSLSAIIKNPINSIIKALNSLIGGLNKIKFDIPDWVPSIGGKSFGFNISKIPLLAQGGYVERNTPQLAVIGDNRHQGEVVAPEDKLKEMALEAVKMAGGNSTDKTVLLQMLSLMQAQYEVLVKIFEKETGISASDIFKSVRSSASEYTRRTGQPAFDY